MKKYFVSVFAILLAAANIFGQDIKPSPKPTPPDDNEVVKISTNLIQVDVTVTDSHGKIISDLKRDEIEIYENGKKQDISNFSFVSNQRETVEKAKEKTPKAPLLPPTVVRPEQVRRAIALVVDDLTLSFESTYYVRGALKKFVDEQMQPGDLVAIIRTGAGIGALQQFTTDKRQLYAAIEKVRWNPLGSGKIGAFSPLEAKIRSGIPTATPKPGDQTTEEKDREFNEFRENVFATGTLGAVNYIVRGMRDLPGRKSIMLLSDGFRIYEKDASGSITTGRVLESLRHLVDQANRASVVIYTMDARGLQVAGLTAADDTSGRTPEEIQQAASDRLDDLRNTQDGLRYLAKETGGKAIVNNNDLSGGIRKILDDQSYYLVAYEPDSETFNPKTRRFNKLVVKVTRAGASVRYRSGFYGVADEKIVRSKETGNQRILNALTSPFAANEIAVRLNALFGSDVKQGSFVRSLLHIRPENIKFTDEPDGWKKAVFDVLAVGFGDNGMVIDQLSKTYTMRIGKDVYEKIMKDGFVYEFIFPIKKPGAYQIRVAMHDHGSEKVGSANQFIEVPDLKKNRLTLSGVALENIPFTEWQKRNAGQKTDPNAGVESNPLIDTSVRRFRHGTVLNYAFTIFNAKLDAAAKSGLTSQIRVFRDGKLIYEGNQKPVTAANQPDSKAIGFAGSLNLGTELQAGDYVLEIAVTDSLAKEKYKTVSQFVQFEIVE